MRLRCMETEAVVMPAPGCANLLLGLDDDERYASARETCRCREAGRSGPDDQHIAGFHKLEPENHSCCGASEIEFRIAERNQQNLEILEGMEMTDLAAKADARTEEDDRPACGV